ncbi:MAG: DUF4270 domain-containing protein [Dysgonamonadaceae bacterium]|jgi:hypothetical protein|nr:DUF4270 domain-containing protein [Dysgonamonadaceae bacterium]
MKTKLFFFSICLSLLCWACDDTLDSVGMGIQPKEDQIEVYDAVFNLEATTIKMDSLYTNTIYGLLGKFYDAQYGDIQAGYLCQYYPSVGFDTIHIIDNHIDSVEVKIWFSTYVGDSLAPMEVTVYPVIKALDNHFYTNVKPENYADLNTVWGKKTYTAYDLSLSDSVRNVLKPYKLVSIPIHREIGQSLFNTYKQNKGYGSSLPNDFLKTFPGTYVKSTFGTGCLINVERTEFNMYYTRRDTLLRTTTQIVDSIVERPTYASLLVTKEVRQLNAIRSSNDSELLKDNDKLYLKAPTGIFAQITIPISDIMQGIGKKKFNSVRLKINADAPGGPYTLPFPGTGTLTASTKAKLLLIEPDSVATFFGKNNKAADFKTTYTTTYTSSTASYDFDNISNLIQQAIDRAKDGQAEDLKLLLIPVQVDYASSTSYGDYDYSTGFSLVPSAITLKKGENKLQIKVIASDLEIDRQ